jgi:acyl-coenzyme A thioesterase PaaI-like protein
MAEATLTPNAVNQLVATAFPGSRARCVEVGTSHAVAEMVTGDLDIRPGGFVAGPTQFALADAALWYLVFGALGHIEPMALTSELSIRFLRPAIGPALHARADLAAISRRSVVGSVTLWTVDAGKPTAVAQGTYALPLAT